MNILLAGVGGQGIILASEILIEVLMRAGYDVKKSEVHGMAQRGGAVSSHVRFGQRIYSPLIEEGTADVILAFEKMESLRYLHYLKPDGMVIVNDQQMNPMTVTGGGAVYPTDIEEQLQAAAVPIIVNAFEIAQELSNLRTINIAMLGALSEHLGVSIEQWLEVISERVPKGTEALNQEAFERGRGSEYKRMLSS